MRVVIVGVGGAGAMAAWRLAQAGHEVVALEQFEIDHDKGSSYGDSRVVRRVYPDGDRAGASGSRDLDSRLPDERFGTST